MADKPKLPDGNPISQAITSWSLNPFGDRFVLNVNNGSFDVKLLLTRAQIKSLQTRTTAVLGEGRATASKLKRHKQGGTRGTKTPKK